jgi:hypothetical protein
MLPLVALLVLVVVTLLLNAVKQYHVVWRYSIRLA